MLTDQILALLITERDRLNAAIAALQGPTATTKRRGRPPANAAPAATATAAEKSTRKKRTFTPAQRKAQAKRMRAYWAAKRKAA